MQKSKGFNNTSSIYQLNSFRGCTVKFKKGHVKAFLPIRIENGIAKYTLKITLSPSGYYRVYVVEPKIKRINNQKTPHIYENYSKWNAMNNEYDVCCLCLHLPGSYEYDREDNLIETIIAWAIKWTQFYEIWLLTGNWYGGGEHPHSKKDRKDRGEG